MASKHGRPGFLYAVSWEVCNPGGGVHTVLATSAPVLAGYYGEDVLCVGPDLWAERASTFVEDAAQPRLAAFAAERDVPVRFGRWAVEGSPPVALVDFGRLLERKNEILGDLWNDFSVDSIHADWDTVERILFGYAAGLFVELHYHAAVRPRARRAVAHVHQWQAAAAVLRIAKTAPEIATVYTPHGTALGRHLADEGIALHRELERIEPQGWAKERGIEAQHTLEAAAAREARILAVVSEHTRQETAHLLGRRPDLVTPNGYTPGAESDPGHRDEVRAAILRASERFLGSALDPATTRIAFSSGRYEFNNKGFDVALRALGKIRERDPKPPRKLLFLIFVSAAKTGGRPEVMRRLKSAELAGEPCGICTHNLARPDDDAICKAARDAGIENRPEDAVACVFVPVLLDGRDPLFPYTYLDVLRASDLSVFPSRYEPWGYTPLESLAAGVPTVTTDATGFGRFVLGLPENERTPVEVLRAGTNGDDALVDDLANALTRFLERPDDENKALGRAGEAVVRRTSWEKQIAPTLQAHGLALERAVPRRAALTSPVFTGISRRSLVGIAARSEDRPRLHDFTVAAALPKAVARLEELARNVWWSWQAGAKRLFESIDAEGFAAAKSNPIRFLRTVDARKLDAASKDKDFLGRYEKVLSRLDAYLAEAPQEMPSAAYFCAEFALHESLPIYSGGLGVLAGDHLKSASDLRIPLVAVGLSSANGYFVQRIQPDGGQGAEFHPTDVRDTPMAEVKDAQGAPVRVTITLPERQLKAGVWRVECGRVPLYLLDTLVAENDAAEREVTDRLYPSQREPRLRQEILLGIGGWRMLKAVGRTPEVCHLNEGHSAFLLLERLLDLVEEEGLTFAEAREVVRASTVFTTHTPVPAGHDRFPEGLMRRYFGHVAQRLGLEWEEFFDLGRATREDHDFSMTVLALKLSGRSNGVSRLHGEVSRDMLANVWPWIHKAETPVDSITNGVHLGTWVGPEFDRLFRKRFADDWTQKAPSEEQWRRSENLPAADVWQAHVAQKLRMTQFLRESVEATGLRRGESPSALRRRIEGIDDDALWIGYARRFAPYKRATLLFQDPERLQALLDDARRPVRVVFAGKSHPDDREGGDLVRKVVNLTADPRFAGRIFYVEDYDMAVGRMLVQGCDVWLNTPTRPLEASGTSGMKACLNGGLHVSILDGWWCEGHDGLGGWAFGEGREYSNPDMQLEYDSRSLYALFETRIAPLFFKRDAEGVPVGWVDRMRHTLATVPAQFNTHRMVDDYARLAYEPLGREHAKLAKDEYAAARARVKRHLRLKEAWEQVRIEDVAVPDPSRGSLGVEDHFEIQARVRLGSLKPDDLQVELYVGPATTAGELRDPVTIPLILSGEPKDGIATYTGAYLPRAAGGYRFGVRVLPALESFTESAHLGLVRWA